MRMHLVSGQNMFRSQVQGLFSQRITGQAQNPGLQKVIQQVNSTYGNRRTRDTVELSQKALDLLNTKKSKQANETKKTEIPSSYQKYAARMFTKEQWAENALSAQRDGIQSVSDAIEHAKSKLKFTMSKMEELENYLNGTGTHSDPNMTKELAETYLYNYKHSIQSDYKELVQSHVGLHQSLSKEYDCLSGGLASSMMENQLDSISAESLGLSNLSDDPKEIMKALENASNVLSGLSQNVESSYAEMTGGKKFAEPARSNSIFNGNSSLRFFESQMERSHRIVDTSNIKFNGQTLHFR